MIVVLVSIYPVGGGSYVLCKNGYFFVRGIDRPLTCKARFIMLDQFEKNRYNRKNLRDTFENEE